MVGLLGLAGSVQATPLYYTFEGTLEIVQDDVGAIANAGISNGGFFNAPSDPEEEHLGFDHTIFPTLWIVGGSWNNDVTIL